MSELAPLELRVGVDVGCYSHNVAIGLSSGEILVEFEVRFSPFLLADRKTTTRIRLPRGGCDGGVQWLCSPVGYSCKRPRLPAFQRQQYETGTFQRDIPRCRQTDRIDTRKCLELFQLRDILPLAKDALQEVAATPVENEILKRLTRRRRRLVNERARVLSNMQGDLQAVCPGLLEITGEAGNLWFLRLLTSTDSLIKLAKLRRATLLKIAGVGPKYATTVQSWQKRAHFSHEAELVGEMIQEDAFRILELSDQINVIEAKIENVASNSMIAQKISTIPGFGPVAKSELAGEVGTINRFKNEAGFALYIGMAALDNSSGKQKGTKTPKHVNTRAKAAMMVAVDRHRKYVHESQNYYEKKRAEGKKHNQAVRALGLHLCHVIFKMLTQEKDYEIRK